MTGDATVFVIDDEASVRKSVARLLRSAGHQVEAFGSAEEFLRRPHYDGSGCLILDVKMPGQSGLELQEALASAGYHLPVIFVSGRSDIPISVKAMKAGAVDFLTKPFQHTNLLKAVEVSLAKDREARASRAEVQEIQQRLETLTAREREVLSLVVAGRLNKQIASELGISEKTVKVHRGRVVEKMRADSVAELVHLAGRVGISGH
ncbi:MAG TPA: response regulator transcription factor [Candidatus Methylomirabilis sp.]|nr:response regulator transcription factor [Candidatus Methylomirabilis sp.]